MTTVTRRWYAVAVAGFGLVMLAMLVIALVAFWRERFGWLVGTWYLPILTSMVFVGALVLLVAVLNVPLRKTAWGIVLILWTLVALTSPLFGILFLVPWGVLLLASPLVVTALVKWRASASTAV